jgi:hypothetical protein
MFFKKVFFLIIALLPFTTTAQDIPKSEYPKVKFSGYAFGDYFYNIKNNDNTKNDVNGFRFRRIYFTFDSDITEKFSTRFRLEMESDLTAKSTDVTFVKDITTDTGGDTIKNVAKETKSLATTNKFTTFVKDAYLQWKGVYDWTGMDYFKGIDIFFGIIPTPTWEISEAAWGYRSIEKTIVDLNGAAGSRDLAIAEKGKLLNIGENGSLNYWIMIGNNGAFSPEKDKYKRYYGQLHFKSGKIQATAYVDFAGAQKKVIKGKKESQNNTLFAGFIGYAEKDKYSFGVEPFYKIHSNQKVDAKGNPENKNTFGFTVFGWYAVMEKLRVVARFDNYDPDMANKKTDGTDKDGYILIIGGIDFLLRPKVHIIPNINFVKYQDDKKDSDLTAMLTFFYNF